MEIFMSALFTAFIELKGGLIPNMKSEITFIMMKEHKVIEGLLEEFEKSHNKESAHAKEVFEAFVWNLEKHMLLEEKILSSVYSAWNLNTDGMFEILKDHGDIMILVNRIKSTPSDSSNLSLLKEFMKDHFVLEETLLYPNLEKILNGEQKEFLIERAQEIIRA
jgi:hemerythrin superfamily protein